MENRKRIPLTASAALLLSVLILQSCGEESSPGNTDPKETVNAPETETQQVYPDNLPEDLDLGGYAVRLFCNQGYSGALKIKAEDGDIINDLLYRRNRKNEERLNYTIQLVEYEGINYEVFVKLVSEIVDAGDDAFDLLCGGMWWSTPLSLKGMLYDMADGKYLELEQPWWATDFIRGLSYKNRIYWLTGPLDISWTSHKMCNFVNLNLWRSVYDDDIYDIVDRGEWTLEKLNACITDVYQDLNGDSKVDDSDRVGFAYPSDMMVESYAYASGVKVAPFDKNGVPYLEFVENPERLTTFWEQMYKIKSNTHTLYIDWSKVGDTTVHQMGVFGNGNLMFATGVLAHTTSDLRGMKDDYGILPLPKLDTAQEKYTTILSDSVWLYGMPLTVTEQGRDAAFAVLEATAAQGYAEVIPAYYEDALKNKYIRDERSIDVINMLSENPICDFGAQYLDLGFYNFLRYEVTNAEIASMIEWNAKAFQKKLDSMLKGLENS